MGGLRDLGTPYLDGFEDDRGSGFVTGTCGSGSDGVHDIHSAHNFAKDGVAVVEPRGGFVGDKELAAVGVGARVRHAQHAGTIVFERGVEFVSKFVAGAACACTKGATALDHEVFDDAVKSKAVIKGAVVLGLAGFGVKPFLASRREADKVSDGVRGLLFKEFNGEVAHTGIKICIKSHAFFLFVMGRLVVFAQS